MDFLRFVALQSTFNIQFSRYLVPRGRQAFLFCQPLWTLQHKGFFRFSHRSVRRHQMRPKIKALAYNGAFPTMHSQIILIFGVSFTFATHLKTAISFWCFRFGQNYTFKSVKFSPPRNYSYCFSSLNTYCESGGATLSFGSLDTFRSLKVHKSFVSQRHNDSARNTWWRTFNELIKDLLFVSSNTWRWCCNVHSSSTAHWRRLPRCRLNDFSHAKHLANKVSCLKRTKGQKN